MGLILGGLGVFFYDEIGIVCFEMGIPGVGCAELILKQQPRSGIGQCF